ncbi:MAG: class I SAM-dependent methyltransferase [Candidatus Nitrospinota bacterium M3_3B_026]
MEPRPNLDRESRLMREGRLPDPKRVVADTIVARAAKMAAEVDVYGEKNVTYGPFIPHLYDALKCRFVFIKRDGRDVVTSLINWHEQQFGNIYRECRESGDLSLKALDSAASLTSNIDTADYARPRPLPGSPYYMKWERMSRLEMCAYYWSTINEEYMDNLEALPDAAWTAIDYTSPTFRDIEKVSRFCGLAGLDENVAQPLLDEKINSLKQRGASDGNFSHWTDWDGGQRRKFLEIAGGTMRRLGYLIRREEAWRPEGFGGHWREKEADPDWYTWMYNSRLKQHRDLVDWVKGKDGAGDAIGSIMDFGCGISIGYSDDFSGKEYTGVDISEKNIEWSRKHRDNPKHAYVNADFISEDLDRKADLVFSSGTIDNSYDIDAFLEAMVRHSKKWIHATAYRGWFPSLREHRYRYNQAHECFYNDISPSAAHDTLKRLGCMDITIMPAATGKGEIPYETKIIARTP